MEPLYQNATIDTMAIGLCVRADSKDAADHASPRKRGKNVRRLRPSGLR
jgi:hypothetical protein